MLTVTSSNDMHRSIFLYDSFEQYWEEEGQYCDFKVTYHTIFYRIKHRKEFFSRDHEFMWDDFLFFCSPLFPRKLKSYIRFKRSKRYWKEVTQGMVNNLTEEINKEIMKDVIKKYNKEGGVKWE